MPAHEYTHVQCKPDAVASSSAIAMKKKSDSSTSASDDDSDDEIGRWIYNSSRTVQERLAAVEAANNNSNGTLFNALHTSGDDDDSITITGTRRVTRFKMGRKRRRKCTRYVLLAKDVPTMLFKEGWVLNMVQNDFLVL